MTVSSRVIVHTYVGNGTQSDWPILFPFFAPEEVKAIRTDVAGGDSALEYGSDYSVVPLEAGGTCICSLGDGERLTLFLELEPTQEVDLRNTGILAPEILERSLDRLTLMVQQQQEQISRCVQVDRTSGLNPSGLLLSIDASADSCISSAQAASEFAGASAGAASAAGAARDEAVAAAASIALPLHIEGDAGRGLVADGVGGWALGGTAAGLNSGAAPEDVARNAVVSSPTSTQAIIKAITGNRPFGWSALDCDAPVMSIVADRLPLFSTNWNGGARINASSQYVETEAWKLLNGTASGTNDGWASASGTFVNGTGDQWVEIDFGMVRTVGAVNIASHNSTDWAIRFPKEFELLADGVVVENVTGFTAAGQGVLQSIPLSDLITCRILRMRITRNNETSGSNYVVFGRLEPIFADLSLGHVGFPAGLQVSYADNGRVKVSEVLGAMASVDLGSAADGFHYLYANLNADGAFTHFGFSDVPMEVGTERKGVDAMPPFADYTLAGWGTASASTVSTNQSYLPWAAFVHGDTGMWSSNELGGWVQMQFTKKRRIANIHLYGGRSTFTGNGEPTRVIVQASDNGADWTDVSSITPAWGGYTIGGGYRDGGIHTIDSEFHYLRLMCTDGVVRNSLACLGAILYFSEDHFNPATQQTLDVDDQSIRRVPLGSVLKSGGKVVAINCYALGRQVTVPANNGDICLDDTDYLFQTPFLISAKAKGLASVKFSDGQFHPVVAHYMTGSSVSVGVIVGLEEAFGVLGVPNILANARTAPTSQGGATVDDSGYVSITIERGY
ncbi:discoidin domain-containing protein [Desulfovibrio mangrovi]|uniref:discoidin domain-containing protein n=1 Tax=Desulfovibrio mangrovi TaxID=2976983 RepID=UPI00224700BE|nr:discoidin domain-containing protein [Desulfovibrio mangrovi]UZP68551.1 discoidin domain-containing protein [Desulfovibrio mangrovi]